MISFVFLDPNSAKRGRRTLSCIPCKKKKQKCDRKYPCSRCKDVRRCVYDYNVEHQSKEQSSIVTSEQDEAGNSTTVLAGSSMSNCAFAYSSSGYMKVKGSRTKYYGQVHATDFKPLVSILYYYITLTGLMFK